MARNGSRCSVYLLYSYSYLLYSYRMARNGSRCSVYLLYSYSSTDADW
jgi:hypothetical protein